LQALDNIPANEPGGERPRSDRRISLVSRMLFTCPVLPFCSLSSKIPHYPSWTVFFELV